jgi:hypothetical protein
VSCGSKRFPFRRRISLRKENNCMSIDFFRDRLLIAGVVLGGILATVQSAKACTGANGCTGDCCAGDICLDAGHCVTDSTGNRICCS